ncbi:MAG: hypothetical protein K2I48_06080 [Muribaculaceae bacterium]|nr:hypothetical protein [Muribaculaceae bacterium]
MKNFCLVLMAVLCLSLASCEKSEPEEPSSMMVVSAVQTKYLIVSGDAFEMEYNTFAEIGASMIPVERVGKLWDQIGGSYCPEVDESMIGEDGVPSKEITDWWAKLGEEAVDLTMSQYLDEDGLPVIKIRIEPNETGVIRMYTLGGSFDLQGVNEDGYAWRNVICADVYVIQLPEGYEGNLQPTSTMKIR